MMVITEGALTFTFPELARQTGTPLIVWKNDSLSESEPPPIKPKKSRSRRVD